MVEITPLPLPVDSAPSESMVVVTQQDGAGLDHSQASAEQPPEPEAKHEEIEEPRRRRRRSSAASSS